MEKLSKLVVFSENVKHLFECFCEVVPPNADKDAWVIQQYPDKYKDLEVLKAVPKFAYPYKFEKQVNLITFTQPDM